MPMKIGVQSRMKGTMKNCGFGYVKTQENVNRIYDALKLF